MKHESYLKKIDNDYLDLAQDFADYQSTCIKVKVGSCIVTANPHPIFGCNHGVQRCTENGCRRIALYGNASKEHRLPSDCDALHSEIDAICDAAKSGISLKGATIYVTRYPCEACARAIAASGIKKVVYGRRENISSYTEEILAAENIEIVHQIGWEREDNNE